MRVGDTSGSCFVWTGGAGQEVGAELTRRSSLLPKSGGKPLSWGERECSRKANCKIIRRVLKKMGCVRCLSLLPNKQSPLPARKPFFFSQSNRFRFFS
ncbi:hypothetical protein CEXT_357871 [Caerostris extrusa]|uniref:Uncharacterized protein n=1 Tax=Caerostris extrusa TaxID=172846 RepID=A0AAV4XUE7_CAEEX|nr:hypothetical protein CEXT_357871 [Caerostris extrusa]